MSKHLSNERSEKGDQVDSKDSGPRHWSLRRKYCDFRRCHVAQQLRDIFTYPINIIETHIKSSDNEHDFSYEALNKMMKIILAAKHYSSMGASFIKNIKYSWHKYSVFYKKMLSCINLTAQTSFYT